MEQPGKTPPLDQADPLSNPGPHKDPVVPGTERPVSLLQERDEQDFAGEPERPPEELPSGDTAGLDHLRLALADLEFPMTRAQLLARAGRWRVPTTGTHFHQLADYVAGVPDDARFGSVEDVVRAIRKSRR